MSESDLPDTGAAARLEKVSFPEWVSPMLATLTDSHFDDPDWVYERKLDGIRCLCFKHKGQVRLLTRNRKSLNNTYPELVEALENQPADNFIVDGEVVAFDGKVTSFSKLQTRMKVDAKVASTDRSVKVFYYLFDLIYLDEYLLTALPLRMRKATLLKLLEYDDVLRYTEHRNENGLAFFEEACSKGWEGIIAKDSNAHYRGSRSKSWLKYKCINEQEFVIVGFTDPQGSRTGFGALLLGYYEDGSLLYAGKVGTGFGESMLESLHKKLQGLEGKTSPLSQPIDSKEIHWVTPKLVAQVKYMEWTPSGSLRHPSFIGLREDKEAKKVSREKPGDKKHTATDMNLGQSIKISNPDKVLFPKSGITKLELVEYYYKIAAHMLPHIEGRPLTLHRYPDGIKSDGFFQKNQPDHFPDWLDHVKVAKGEDDTTDMTVINSRDGLVYIANQGTITPHIWLSRLPDLDCPDRMIFDLDPSTDDFEAVRAGAFIFRDFLEGEMKLKTFLSTTGSRGLHITVPISGKEDFKLVKEFAKSVCILLAKRHPADFTVEHRKAKRKGRLFLDYLRNEKAQTAVAPFAVRVLENAPVSTPISWEELEDQNLNAQTYNIRNIFDRLEKVDDPWKGFFRFGKQLGKVVGGFGVRD